MASRDSDYMQEMLQSREDDRAFARRYMLGQWTPHVELPDVQIESLATNRRAAEMVRTEDVMKMAYEIAKHRGMNRQR